MRFLNINDSIYHQLNYIGKEAELRKIVSMNLKEILRVNNIFLKKSKIKPWENLKSIPYGFIIFLKEKIWFLLDIIIDENQFLTNLPSFITALNDPHNKELIRNYIYYEISTNKESNELYNLFFPNHEVQKILNNVFEKPPGVLIITENKMKFHYNPKIEKIIISENINFIILEFNVFLANQNLIYVYETLDSLDTRNQINKLEILPTSSPKILPISSSKIQISRSYFKDRGIRLGKSALSQIFSVLTLIYNENISFQEASTIVADFLCITYNTVTNKFYRGPISRKCLKKEKLSLREVISLIQKPIDLKQILKREFPEKNNIIDRCFENVS